MSQFEKILAKSEENGGLTLLEHTEQVTNAIVLFATRYDFDFDIEMARKGAILHDLGKAHPHFQRKIRKIEGKTLEETREWDFIHRHEISSLGFLPCFPKEYWGGLIDLVVAHHKSIKDDPSGRGILDLDDTHEDFIDNHLRDWDDWSPHGLEILAHFELPNRPISRDEAQKAIEYVVDYCEKKRNGVSWLRGLIKSADHFASAFMHDTDRQLEHLFELPDIGFYHDASRKSDLFPLSQIETTDARPHTLVVAPTGAGKTDFLMRRTKGRVFYTLPFQASINAMWERFGAVVKVKNEKNIRLLHATSKIVVRNGSKRKSPEDLIDEQILQPLAGAAVKVLTPHQLAAIIFGTSGFETMMLDLKGTDVILDEIHTYSDFSRSMVLEIVKSLLRLNCRIHIGTATMPTVLYNELREILGGGQNVYEVQLNDTILDKFDRHQIQKIDLAAIPNILSNAFAQKEKVLLIFNTVKDAQNAYETYKNQYEGVPKMLIHSRFRRKDRVRLEKTLKEEFDGSHTKNGGFSPCLVIATQVVEVSLDISFDRMITMCAPLDGLIQRFGRVNRRRTETTIGKYKPVHVVRPADHVKPYEKEVIDKSFDQLPDNFDILKERSLQAKIDQIYPTLDRKPIDMHLIFKEDYWKIKELTSQKKAVLVEALEIESATCILSTDEAAYLNGNWETRPYLEIPVSYSAIKRKQKKYKQLEVGAYPFVIPQAESECEEVGLKLI